VCEANSYQSKISSCQYEQKPREPKPVRLQPEGSNGNAGAAARIVGSADEVMARVRRLWKPGLKLIVGTHIHDATEQHGLYEAIHEWCR